MRKALVVQGSPTTTGGVVVGGSATHMTDRGKPFALYGDDATCGRCEGRFRIVGTAARRTYRGRAGVLEGDLILCPCGQNRVMASENPGCFYEDDGMDTAAGLHSAIGASTSSGAYDEQYVLRDAATGQPLGGVRYEIRTGSRQVFSGVTDDQGRTLRIVSNTSQNLQLAIIE